MTSAFTDQVKFQLRKLRNALSLPAGAGLNALYKVRYDQVHNPDQAQEISDHSTIAAFDMLERLRFSDIVRTIGSRENIFSS